MAYRSKREIMEGVENVVKSKIIARNTVEYVKGDGTVVVRLHRTDIITRTLGGMYVLNSGGWQTVTTKDRINKFSPAFIRSEKGIWMMNGHIPFFDGVIIDQHGAVQNPEDAPRLSDLMGLKDRINRFVKLVDTCETLPVPDNGDCWYCRFFKGEDNEHLISHVNEHYLHGSLLVNAMRWAGYNDHSISLHFQMDLRDTFKRVLRRYMKHSLDLGG